MKFIPRNTQVIGRMVIKHPTRGEILLIDDTAKTTKFLLVDAVGDGAFAAGVRPGDLVVTRRVENIIVDDGKIFVPMCDEKDIATFVRNIPMSDLLVQIDNGKEFVAFDSPKAALALSESESTGRQAA